MKRLVLFSVFSLALGVVFAAPQPTPVSGHIIAKTPQDKLTIRIRQQNIQISRDLRAGKLTKDQAKNLRGQVEAIRKAEITDLKQNKTQGVSGLTDAQISQLNEQLNILSKSIPVR